MKSLLQGIKRNRTLYMQLGFTALAFLAMILLSYIFMNNVVRSHLVRNVNSMLDFAQERVSSGLLESRLTLEGFSEKIRRMILDGATKEELETYIDNMTEYTQLGGDKSSGVLNFYGYFETLEGGHTLISGEHWAQPEDEEVHDLEWYREATLGQGLVVETTPYVAEDGMKRFTYAVALYDDDGTQLGVVGLDVQIDTIGNDIVNLALNQSGYGMMIGPDFTLLVHPNPNFIGIDSRDPSFPPSVFAVDMANGEEIFERSLYSYRNEPSVAFFRTLSNGWHLGIVMPRDQYYRSINNMFGILFVVGAALAAVLFVILVRIDKARVKSDEESRQKSAFLANMSHEIRTPINAIVGMTAIGRSADNDERKDYCFAKIDDASKHLLGVINDILDISKIEANKIELSSAEFSFEKMLQRVVNVINFRMDEKHQKLTVYIDKNIPQMLIADDQRFAQVITNLIGNAIKFTPDGGSITVNTKLVAEDGGMCTILVEIIDTGIGISLEQQEKLFRPFEQAESDTTRKFGGTGLGLAISKSIVEMMGGSIWVRSVEGQGSTFAFTVHATRGQEPTPGLWQQNVNWKNIRILTVDDDQAILDYFQQIVSGFGARCEVALSAGEALHMLEKTGAYNVYFVDLRMPGVDGIALTREIRSREKNLGNAIVIMISSADLSGVEEEAKKAGVNKFLLKPLFPSAIADAINECIGVVNEKKEDLPLDIDGIFENRHILLVEDMAINREIVIALLESTLVQIDCAENGHEAVRLFRDNPTKYDLIFMDVQMPEMDGYEATRQIRALDLPTAATVPIVAMTANVFREDIEACLAAGMNSHVGKPLDMEDLLETMMGYLGETK